MKKLLSILKHLFTPHKSNRHRSKLIHHDMLTSYLLFAIILTFGVYHVQQTNGSILGFATDISNAKLLNLTNKERAKSNLPELKYNLKLEEAAMKKAQNMFAQNYWSHYGPNGETPWQFVLQSGYQYEYAGENLAKNFLFSDGVVAAWMNSPTHRENILRKEYTDVGFAVLNGVLNGEETTLVVQMFAKPLYGSISGSPTQSSNTNNINKENESGEAVLNTKNANENKNNFYSVFVNINVIFFIILICALILDFYLASKLNLIHLKGKNIIHIIFLATLSAAIYFIIKGTIV